MARIKQRGFVADNITPDQYVFGSEQLGGEVLQEDGQWDDYLPEKEIQRKNRVETMSCVSFGTLNCLETLFKRVYGTDNNYSDRFLAVVSETTKRGNSPHKVGEALRRFGSVKEEVLPFSDDIKSWDDYHSGITDGILKKGGEWLDDYNFGHDWVFTRGSLEYKQKMIKAGLRYSPIGVSVYAWKQKGGYYYKNDTDRDNHWCTVYGYEDGKYWKVYDHYDNVHKKLVWDYNFGFAKRYTISKRQNEKSYDFLKDIYELFKEMFLKVINKSFIDQSKKREIVEESITRLNLIKDNMDKANKTAQECLLQLTKDNLNRDITPEDNVPDEVACAESVSVLIKKIDNNFPIIPHTMNLYKTLNSSPSFEPTLDLEAGNIIISPTGHWRSNGKIRGHVGVITENGNIASNNSYTGNFEENYTISSWVKRYRGIGNYPLFVFKMVDKNVKMRGSNLLGSNSNKMFKNFSSEQTANYVTFFVFITEILKLNITESEIETIVKGIIGAITIGYVWFKRYQEGNITVLGKRKNV